MKNKIYLIVTMIVLGFGNSYSEVIMGPSLHFDNKSSKVIYNIASDLFYEEILKKTEKVYLDCFTDSDGSEELNQRIAKERCESATKFIRDSGYSGIIEIEIHGSKVILHHEEGRSLKDVYGRKALNRMVMVQLDIEPEKEVVEITNTIEREVVKVPKHRTQLFFGNAADGVELPVQEGPGIFSVSEDRDWEMGFAYTYSFNKHFNLSGLAFTNKSFFLGIGKDW